MKTRIITAVVMVLAVLPIIIFSHTVAFPIAVSLVSLVSAIEIMRCTGCSREIWFSLPSALLSAVIPLGGWFIEDKKQFIFFTVAVLYLFFMYVLCATVLKRGKQKISDSCFNFAALVYVITGYTSVVLIRCLDKGAYLYLMVFVASCVTDIFAYFTGRLLGKHKLIVEVSPKKTVEGAIGGLLFCSLGFAVYGFCIGQMFGTVPNYIALAVAGAILSVISQFGDLIASLIKRQYGIKDFGRILPGHGGLLDRFDSSIAIAPVMLILCSFPQFFTLFG
ncbi:MAG: phosphatidate cytidylyltransferase [Clostridia bacterium]|nr:phosphatidate cytidylyltransferase [Clostridia bacterium]